MAAAGWSGDNSGDGDGGGGGGEFLELSKGLGREVSGFNRVREDLLLVGLDVKIIKALIFERLASGLWNRLVS